MKHYLCLLLALLLAVPVMGAEDRKEQDIIEEMVVLYGAYGEEAEQEVAEHLSQLSRISPETGEKWGQIMDLWASKELDIHEDVLPDGLPDTDELCLVALGFQLNPDGSMRDELLERLRVLKRSAEKYPQAMIVCTGGGTASENPSASEAGEMAKWLAENGIDPARIIVEDKSLTTAQNAIFTFDILTEQYPQVSQLAIVSSDYHIATGTLLFGAEAILREADISVVSNAAWKAPSGSLSAMFQAGALIELSGDVETAFEIYYETYDIHELPPIKAPAPVTQEGRPESNTNFQYTLKDVHPVDGRQGIAWMEDGYVVSGSAFLSRYDKDWNCAALNDEPFKGLDAEVNHIGDIDVYQEEIYAGVEYFMDGEASNIQIVVYDAMTLELLRTYPIKAESGQTEVSGIAVDADTGSMWLCSWADGESGRYLYRYDLESGEYLGKFHLQPVPQWIQGASYHDGFLYLTSDDGTADLGEPDHVYRCEINLDSTAWPVLLERTLDDVTLQGEIEGISFSEGEMLISYNRGARIVQGMPKGFYEGYDQEIHEVFVYEK